MSGIRPRLASALTAILAVALGGCTSIHGHQGYVVDRALAATVAPGVDNRESVQRTLGRPSFAGEFDPQSTWYYVSRDTRQFAFGRPKPVQQTVLIVHFDPAGNVASVDRTGMDKIARIDPVKDKTPTRGRHSNLFQDLFGNIGTMGSAQGGSTADNPGTGGGSGSGR
jgi:outer membrane protein assembly factor BamE (lipoprotein component of BamABCDE complex)